MEIKITEETCKEFNAKIKEAYKGREPVSFKNYYEDLFNKIIESTGIPENMISQKYDSTYSCARKSILNWRWQRSVDEFRKVPTEQNSLTGLA